MKKDAAKLLISLQITDASFSTACDILKNRYDNKRLILGAHVQAIVSQKPVTNENPKSLRDLMQTVEEHRLALIKLGQPVEIRTSFPYTALQRNCPTKRENVGNFHHQEQTPNATLIYKKSSWKKEHEPLKQTHSS